MQPVAVTDVADREMPRPATARKGPWQAPCPAALTPYDHRAARGHNVTVYEEFARAGGVRRCGIPDFKREKRLIGRRIHQTDFLRVGHGERLAREHHVERGLQADQARHALRAAGAGNDAQRDLRQAEARALLRDAVVAGQRLSLIHISEPTRPYQISHAGF